MRILWLALLLSLFCACPAVAYTFDDSKCNDDNITVVPSYAEGRDAQQCLLVDPGNGDPPVRFQHEFRDIPKALDRTVFNSAAGTPWRDETQAMGIVVIDMMEWDSGATAGCRGSTSNVCTYLLDNVTIDNYGYYFANKQDGLHFGSGPTTAWLWCKDCEIINTFRCNNSVVWDGPGGPNQAGCPTLEVTGKHMDGIQMEGHPHFGGVSGAAGGGGGFQIFTGGAIANGMNANIRIQKSPAEGTGPAGVLAYHGTRIGRVHPLGLSTNYYDECLKFNSRGTPENQHPICAGIFTNNNVFGSPVSELWFANVVAPAPASAGGYATFEIPGGDQGKVVIVNSGCDHTGCTNNPANISYVNGWPHPVTKINAVNGPGTCPGNSLNASGLIKASSPPTYCYTRMEYAAGGTDTTHQLFPFADKACDGWETCPSVGGPSALNMNLSTDQTGLDPNEDFTFTATPFGGTSPYTVKWDCDDDGLYGIADTPDGTEDSASPYTVTCPGFATPGSYTPGARLVDSAAGQIDRDVLVTVSTPSQCGDNVIQPPEVCDGTALSGNACTDPEFGTFTGGALACAPDCTGYSTAGCTGGTGASCSTGTTGTCEFGENATSCFHDCAEFVVDVYAKTQQSPNWESLISPLENASKISYSGVLGNQIAFDFVPVTPSISSFYVRLCDAAGANCSPLTSAAFTGGTVGVQNSPRYAPCGDNGAGIENLFSCDPIALGSYTLKTKTCTGNYDASYVCATAGTGGESKEYVVPFSVVKPRLFFQ